MPVDLLAVGLHQRRCRCPEAQAEAVVVRPQLKPEGGPSRPVLVTGTDAPPQVILVGAPAVEPPGVPVNAGYLQDQRLVGKRLVHRLIDLFAQLLDGSQEGIDVLVLVRHKPAPLIVEADAPHEVHRLRGKALKCHGKTLLVVDLLPLLYPVLPQKARLFILLPIPPDRVQSSPIVPARGFSQDQPPAGERCGGDMPPVPPGSPLPQ